MKTLFFLTLLAAHTISAQGIAYKNISSCNSVPEEIFQSSKESVLNLKVLPQGLYLARSVIQSVEKPEGDKYFSYQSLASPENTKNYFCYQGVPDSKVKIQAFVPTMIDMTQDHQWGNAFWSFALSADKKAGAVEASRSLVPALDYKTKLQEQGYTVTERQKSHNEFEIRLQRNVANWKETIILLYDQF